MTRYVIEIEDGFRSFNLEQGRVVRIYALDDAMSSRANWPTRQSKPLTLWADDDADAIEQLRLWLGAGQPATAEALRASTPPTASSGDGNELKGEGETVG